MAELIAFQKCGEVIWFVLTMSRCLRYSTVSVYITGTRSEGGRRKHLLLSYVDGVVDVLLVAVENVQADGERLDATLGPAMASLFLLLLLFFLLLLLLLFVTFLSILLLAFLLCCNNKSSSMSHSER